MLSIKSPFMWISGTAIVILLLACAILNLELHNATATIAVQKVSISQLKKNIDAKDAEIKKIKDLHADELLKVATLLKKRGQRQSQLERHIAVLTTTREMDRTSGLPIDHADDKVPESVKYALRAIRASENVNPDQEE